MNRILKIQVIFLIIFSIGCSSIAIWLYYDYKNNLPKEWYLPTEIGFYSIPTSTPNGIVLDENYAYITTEEDGFFIINLSDLGNPTLEGHLNSSYELQDLTVQGNFVYLVGASGLDIVDISNKSHPFYQSHLDYNWKIYSIYVKEDLAILGCPESRFRFVNISNASNPVEIGQFLGQGKSFGIDVVGDLAFMSNEQEGVYILNISDPVDPIEIFQLAEYGEDAFKYNVNAWDVHVLGEILYVSDTIWGVMIFDISNITSPEKIGRYYDGGKARDFTIDNDFLLLADNSDGIEKVRISNPTNPIITGKFEKTVESYDVCIRNGIIFSIDKFGLRIIKFDPGFGGDYYDNLADPSYLFGFLSIAGVLILMQFTWMGISRAKNL